MKRLQIGFFLGQILMNSLNLISIRKLCVDLMNYQNVLMTGYYSPILYARHTPQGQFKNPIYRMPVKKRLSRVQIYAGALVGERTRVSI